MAILGDIEVKVLVNDQSTQEYEDDENETRDPNLVIQYIEAISSAAFAIKISVPSHYEFTSDAISFDIMLDGRRATDRLLAKVKHSKDGPWEQTVAGVTKNGLHGGNLKPFLFSEVARAEEFSVPARMRRAGALKDVGTVAVKVLRQRILRQKPVQDQESWRFDTNGTTELPEKKLNAMSVTHSYRFGKERKTENSILFDAEYIDGEDKPIAVFTFRYRSKKALQDMLLIPRTPTPPPLEDRPLEELSVEELRELARRQKALIKFKVKPDADSKPEFIKPEHGIKRGRDEEYEELLASAKSKRVKLPRPFSQGEKVDLDDE